MDVRSVGLRWSCSGGTSCDVVLSPFTCCGRAETTRMSVVRRTAGRSSANRRHVDHSALPILRGPGSAGQCAPAPELPERSRGTDTTVSAEEQLGTAGIAHRHVGPDESQRASRAWWDADADDYLAEHG